MEMSESKICPLGDVLANELKEEHNTSLIESNEKPKYVSKVSHEVRDLMQPNKYDVYLMSTTLIQKRLKQLNDVKNT